LGTYLMAVGTALSIENWILLSVITVLFAVIYHYIILDEETKLRRIFGTPYERYCELVPRFFPRLFPPFMPARTSALTEVNPEPLARNYSRELFWKNKAYEPYATFFALMAGVAAVAWAWHFV
ncbi:MAG: methyltransferase family protein, partial [Bdellovibrionota bacterium]